MNLIENFFLNMGMSWTMSKLLPYAFTILIGIVLIVPLRKFLKNRIRIVKWGAILILLLFPFAIYFIFNPIYEGDFSSQSFTVNKTSEYAELEDGKLIVLAIPNCPFCFEAIEKLKTLKKRIPNAKIEYIVCTSDTINSTSYVDWYQGEAGDALTVTLAENTSSLLKLARHSFPTFVFVGEDLKSWSNDNFGVVALDEVEKLLK